MSQLRKAFSLLLLYSVIIEVVSGIVLYAGPLPRVANTLEWQFLGIGKRSWDELHTIFGFVLLIAAVAHLGLNYRAIVGYIRCRVRARITKSFVAATLITVLVTAGTLLRWEPFNWTLDTGESMRRAWAAEMIRQRPEMMPPAMRQMMLQRLREGRPPQMMGPVR